LTQLKPPGGADVVFWKKWLRHRAALAPFIWPNHREAIAKQFYESGKSAVVVLPTGAGKTTLSSLKIAGTLARKKKVVFLAPTHALVEQLTTDLQRMFPKELLGSVVSSDFDLLMLSDTQLKEIEVMTPERCLAMLSFAPTAFDDVGLLVFDECHLLSPQSGKIRRALDSMLCDHLARLPRARSGQSRDRRPPAARYTVSYSQSKSIAGLFCVLSCRFGRLNSLCPRVNHGRGASQVGSGPSSRSSELAYIIVRANAPRSQ
jgi:hypothetical protein